MSSTTNFPLAKRVWESNVALYRDHLDRENHSAESVEKILAELKLFHERLYAYETFMFDIQPLKESKETPFSQEQLNLVAISANKLTNEFGQHLAERMGIASALILHLLQEKYGK